MKALDLVPVATMVREVTKLDFGRLQVASGQNFNEADRRRLLESLNRYLVEAAIADVTPNIPEVKSQIKKIKESSAKLCALLADTSDLGQAVVSSIFPFHRGNPLTLTRTLRDLELSCRVKLQDDLGGKKSGRNSQVFLKPFLQEVGEVFDSAAGSRVVGVAWDHRGEEFVGPLLDLVCELLDQAKLRGGADYSRNTIALVLRKLRAGKRRMTGHEPRAASNS